MMTLFVMSLLGMNALCIGDITWEKIGYILLAVVLAKICDFFFAYLP